MFLRAGLAVSVWLTLAALLFQSAAAETPSAARRPTDRVRLLDVPYVPQTAALCGGAAIAMVFRYWGEPAVLAEEFLPLIENGEAGIRTDAMVRAVRSRGWSAVSIPGTPSDVREQLDKGRPVIALIQVGPGLYHYVVVVAWANGGVILHDPAVAPFRTRSEKAFNEAWRGGAYWAVVILPAEGKFGPADDGSAPMAVSPPVPQTGCDAIVEDAIVRARNGDTTGAEDRLRSAMALCPESAAPLRGLAGLRFKAEDWLGAARFAQQALDLDPDDRYTWRLLAGSRFLLGDEDGALRAWNRVSEPRADLPRIDGLARTRYRAVSGQLGLQPGRLLTSGAYLRARRRLAELPAHSQSRLSLTPFPQGSAQVNVAVLERPLLFSGPLDAGAAGLRAFAEREVSLRVASPTGNGELWTAGYRWQRERPSASLTLAVPAPGGRPGLWRVEGLWERQAYAGSESLGPDGVLRAVVTREERRRTVLTFADWVAPNLRLEFGAGLDKWTARGAHLSIEGKLESRLAHDRLALNAEVAQWTSLDGSVPFEAAGLLARWSSEFRADGRWLARLGVLTATAAAPLALWPGAGTGRGREPLLRAHPLLDDGVVAGRAFGRTLVHTGLERQDRIGTVKSIRFGWSVFVDGAKPLDPWRTEREPWQFDGGAGIRLAAPGGRGAFRIDAAHGFTDGASAFSVGWEVR